MNTKTYIHIGFPKTGTTWFQECLFPQMTSINYISKKITNQLIIDKSVFEFNKADIQKYFENTRQDRPLLLSSEKIVGTLNRGWMNGYFPKENANRIKNIFGEAKIIVFLRQQQDAISSAYQQYIKNGGTYSVNKYIHSNTIGLFHPDHLKYHYILDLYSNLFGKENLHVFLFEDFKRNPKEFTTRFINELNINCNIEEISFNPINESPSRWAILPLRLFNLFRYKSYPHKLYILPIPYIERLALVLATICNFGKKVTTKKLLGSENILFLENYYRESNNYLIEKYKLDAIRQYNYPL